MADNYRNFKPGLHNRLLLLPAAHNFCRQFTKELK